MIGIVLLRMAVCCLTLVAARESIRASWAPLAEHIRRFDLVAGVEGGGCTIRRFVLQHRDLCACYEGSAGETHTDIGKFMEVWKRQPDGGWKAIADTYNSDLPAQP